MKRCLFVLVLFCCSSSSLYSQPSQLINYQGKLTQKDGTAESGSFKIVFSVYSDTTSNAALWEETQLVTVQNGVFNILLGSYKPFSENLFNGGGNRFLGIKVGNDPEMKPRFQLTSVPYAIQPVIPQGVVVMWSGTIENIPYGWALCDGKDYPRSDGMGTIKAPDLKDKFIVGAGSDKYPIASIGGLEKVIPTGSIALSGDVGNTTLGINQMPQHQHKLGIYDDQDFGGKTALYGYEEVLRTSGWVKAHASGRVGYNTNSEIVGGGQSHNHPLAGTATFTGNLHENRPPYYALAFIMKL